MQKVRATLSTYIANRLLKGDQLILETKDKSTHKTKEFVVEIIRVTSDIPRCSGCAIRLDNKTSYKYRSGHFCKDCYDRRIDQQREITQLSAKKK